jgi:hypothetical protein
VGEPAVVVGGFEWTRPVPPEWAADLASYSPPNPRIPYLWLTWYPGLPPDASHRFLGDVVQRWALYQITPNLDVVPLELMEDLRGPHPATVGRWVEREPNGPQFWVSDSLVSRTQWQLFRETGGYPALYWIIQGDRGGHAWQFEPEEANYLRALGKPDAPPRPGALAYAPYDRRVRDQLLARDKLRQWRQSMDWDARMARTEAGLWVNKERSDAQAQYAHAMLAFLDTQIHDAVSDIPHRYVEPFAEQLRADGVLEPSDASGNLEALDETFVTDLSGGTRGEAV